MDTAELARGNDIRKAAAAFFARKLDRLQRQWPAPSTTTASLSAPPRSVTCSSGTSRPTNPQASSTLLMNQMGMAGIVRGHKRPETTTPGDAVARPPDLLDHDFTKLPSPHPGPAGTRTTDGALYRTHLGSLTIATAS